MILRTLRYAASVILRRAWTIASRVAPARSDFRCARQPATGKRYRRQTSNCDNIALYSSGNVAVFSALLDQKTRFNRLFLKRFVIPVTVNAFSVDIYAARRSWAQKAHPN